LDYLVDLTIVGISLGMVYGLVALGISFIYSGLDIVHFAHGEVYMIGAFLGVPCCISRGSTTRPLSWSRCC